MEPLDEFAKEFVDGLLSDLDVGGGNYSPDLRDSLNDHREWLEGKIAEMLETAIGKFR